MIKIKPQPTSRERFKKLCEAFLQFSRRTGVKVTITIEPAELEVKEEEEDQQKYVDDFQRRRW